LKINGPAEGLTVHGDGDSRVLAVETSAKAVISNLTITGGVESKDYGGGVYNRGTLFLLNCTVTDNRAHTRVLGGYGGGLYNVGTLTLDKCTVSKNDSSYVYIHDYGGGLANDKGTVILADSAFTDNVSGWEGGGVYNDGKAYVTNCTFAGNSAKWGGGLFNEGDPSEVVSCTFVNNTANEHGGGIFLEKSLDMWDTIVAGNKGPADSSRPASDVYGERISDLDGIGVVKVHSGGNGNPAGGHNLIGITAGSYGWGTEDLKNVTDPGLLALAPNGGPTKTVALASNSPAINRGIKVAYYAGTDTPLTTDQRGFKLDTPNPDIGAYQFQH
jgi:predicted outer membrane repeat protein